ncbi:MAG: hypothetical protein ABF685_22395 [Clostridium saccharoperbutylacetonicum]
MDKGIEILSMILVSSALNIVRLEKYFWISKIFILFFIELDIILV